MMKLRTMFVLLTLLSETFTTLLNKIQIMYQEFSVQMLSAILPLRISTNITLKPIIILTLNLTKILISIKILKILLNKLTSKLKEI